MSLQMCQVCHGPSSSGSVFCACSCVVLCGLCRLAEAQGGLPLVYPASAPENPLLSHAPSTQLLMKVHLWQE